MTDSELSPTLARAGRSATLLLVVQLVLFLMFVAGGLICFWTFWQNGRTSVDCSAVQAGACGAHHSYVLGVTLLAVGFFGNLIAMVVGARLAIGVGLGALSRYQQRQRQG